MASSTRSSSWLRRRINPVAVITLYMPCLRANRARLQGGVDRCFIRTQPIIEYAASLIWRGFGFDLHQTLIRGHCFTNGPVIPAFAKAPAETDANVRIRPRAR